MAASSVQTETRAQYLRDAIDNLKEDELLIICAGRKTRKALHQFLETNYQNLGQTGVLLPHMKCAIKTMTKCSCGAFYELKYIYGSMKNNVDEYYRGSCHKCDEETFYEPAFDDRPIMWRVNCNNAVVVGRRVNFQCPLLAKSEKEDEEFLQGFAFRKKFETAEQRLVRREKSITMHIIDANKIDATTLKHNGPTETRECRNKKKHLGILLASEIEKSQLKEINDL